MRVLLLIAVGCLVLSGCGVPVQNLDAPAEQKITLGTVQQSFYKGMSQAEVVSSLGAPNMVARDKDGTETWVYEKSSTTVATSHSSVYGTVLLIGGVAKQSAAITSQRTLTLILKFRVGSLSDFTYRYTSF